MENLFLQLPEWAVIASQFLGALAILATVIVRLTPSKLDDEKVKGIVDKILKLINYLPTLGINPRTKKLEEAYKELSAEKKASESV